MSKIQKILIANRGEIAIRIMRTCKKLSIQTVAVYSEVDKDMPFVKFADEKVYIGESEAKKSYLDINKILEACKQTSADAVHPGYGFLSENFEFAKVLEENGIKFIGPGSEAIRIMGDKVESRKKMASAGVSVIPGYEGDDQSPQVLLEQAKKIGFPLMIKASAGGGGKGMRRVDKESDFFSFLESAKREALNFFANDKVFLEKFISSPRHIEVQVFGDDFGNYVHFYERDCSVQRRHQKVIEEAPAPHLSEKQKNEVYEKALLAASSIGYKNAGTVEFVLSPEGEFYFLEMNTRLQVEHPVTEMVTGLDLVELQIKIASGEKIPFRNGDENFPILKGHSIEVRICAEEGGNTPIPQTGTILKTIFPKGDGIRLDTGVDSGSEVSIFYDSMLAKLIIFAEDRESCIQKLLKTLSNSAILGVSTNLNYLHKLISHPEFQKGGVNTKFIEEYIHSDYLEEKSFPERAISIAHYIDGIRISDKANDLFAGYRNWTENQTNLSSKISLHYTHLFAPKKYKFQDRIFSVLYSHHRGYSDLFKIEWDSESKEEIFEYLMEVKSEKLVFEDGEAWLYARRGNTIYLCSRNINYKLEVLDTNRSNVVSNLNSFKSPMPGKIISIHAEKGKSVKEGDPLITIEAMKMENTIFAPKALTVVDIYFQVGSQVSPEDELLKVNF